MNKPPSSRLREDHGQNGFAHATHRYTIMAVSRAARCRGREPFPVRRWVRRRLSEAFKKRMVVIHNGQHDSFIDVPATGRDAGNGEADQLE